MKKICLVACVKSKERVPSAASDLYTSPLFIKSKQYAEYHCDSWKILSAKHGLVDTESILSPYNETLNNANETHKKLWAESVFSDLRPILSAKTEVILLAGINYRKYLVPMLQEIGISVRIPMENLSLGNQLKWLNSELKLIQAKKDLDRFYELLKILEDGLGGKSPTNKLTSKTPLPKQGIYFFFENSESRVKIKNQLRVVRVGTHGVSKGSKSTLWNRIKTHKGNASLGGNHRGSIFRLHIGNALIKKSNETLQYPDWGIGQNADKEIKQTEAALEKEVSKCIGDMKILWLSVPGESSADNDRAYLERNIIGLLTTKIPESDNPSPSWLGNYSNREIIKNSGLWNIDHVGIPYDPNFLDVLSQYVDFTIGKTPYPSKQLAPRDWNKKKRKKKKEKNTSIEILEGLIWL